MTTTRAWWSALAGFVLLFDVYHAPEPFSGLGPAAIGKGLFFVVAVVLARVQAGRGLGAWGLGLHPGWAGNLARGVAIGVAFSALSLVVSSALGLVRVTSVAPARDLAAGLPLVLVITLVPSLAEDILTRGYPYHWLGGKLGAARFVVASATLFVLNHIWRLGDGAAVLSYLFVLGLALAFALTYTRSLWLTLGLHWGGNIVYQASVSLFAVEERAAGRATTWILCGAYALMLVVIVAGARWLGLRRADATAR